jgi:regulator of protease activity HflC (stomatin/prohibitin superfamily)
VSLVLDPNMLLVIVALLLVVLVVTTIVRAVQIIPQATAAVVERLGRFKAVEEPGLVFLVPFVDKIRARIDLREQVRSFPPQPVITKDNLTVNIDTVVYYQVTDPKAAVYEIADYINGVEQTTTTTLRNVVGGLSLEETLTARDEINSQLRGELDKVTGGWGIRIARVEIKAIEPPASIQESMERQMKADREKRAMILTAEGQRESAIRSAEGNKQSQILTAEGAKQAAILNAEADRQSRILRAQGERAAQYLQAQGEAKAIEKVFAAIKSGRPTPELLAYQYLQTLPQMAQGDANKVWIVPSDFGKALEGFTKMLGAPGGDGVFRFEPSPVEDSPPRPEEDDDSIKDWFNTSSDPEIARVVADAEAQARAEIPPPFSPSSPVLSSPPAPELSSPAPDELGPGDSRVGLPPGANRNAAPMRPAAPGRRPSGSAEWSSGAGERSPAPRPRSGPAGGSSSQSRWSDGSGRENGSHDPATSRGGSAVPESNESAVPTSPRGIPRVDEDPDTVEHVNPARPGYPSPPRSSQS